jgi:hypothetical protein
LLARCRCRTSPRRPPSARVWRCCPRRALRHSSPYTPSLALRSGTVSCRAASTLTSRA